MNIQGIFTEKGLALAAKLTAGGTLTITRVVAGEGTTQTTAAAMSRPKQTLAVNTPTRSGDATVIAATLPAAMAPASYSLGELGIYASDPDEGEILYKLYRLEKPVEIINTSRMVLRFYLEETVSQTLQVTVERSSAGLLTEADLEPVQKAVFSQHIPSRTVSLNVTELPAFLNRLPRLLTEDLTIQISGTLEDPVGIHGFYGSGSIRLVAADEIGCTFKRRVHILECSIAVWLQGLRFDDTEQLEDIAMVRVQEARNVRILNCVFLGAGSGIAVSVSNFANVEMDSCSIRKFNVALSGYSSSVIVAMRCQEVSENTYGIHAGYGMVVMLGGSSPDLMGGASNYKYSGAMIVSSNNTLL